MDMGGRSLHFLDLFITIVNNQLVTSVYSKPTNAHVYLNAKSSHPRSQIRGIAKGVALTLRRIYVLRIVIFMKKAKYTPNILLIVATIVFMLIEYLRKWV
jgi:hypothetical protein